MFEFFDRKSISKVSLIFMFFLVFSFLSSSFFVYSLDDVNFVNLQNNSVKYYKSFNAYFFYSSTCPHCHNVLNSGVLSNDIVNVKNVLITKNSSFFRHFNDVIVKDIKLKNYYSGAVPTLVIFNDSFVKFDKALQDKNFFVLQGDKDIINFFNNLSVVEKDLTVNSSVKIDSYVKSNFVRNSFSSVDSRFLFDSNFFSLKNWTILFFTGLSDSINPCIMSVLALLLAQLFLLKAKKRILKTSFIFISVIFVSYFLIGLFILFGASLIVSRLTQNFSFIGSFVKIFISLLLFVAGLVNVKDFFAYGKGFSFQLPDKYKNKIMSLAKKLTVGAIFSIALIVTLVEFPCSGIMYLGVITGMLFSKIPLFNSILYILFYDLLFILPLILITFFSLKVKSEEFGLLDSLRLKYRKWFRLIMGLVLILLSYFIFIF